MDLDTVHAAIIGGINIYRRRLLEAVADLPEDVRGTVVLEMLAEHVSDAPDPDSTAT